MGWLRLAAFLAVTGLGGILLPFIARALTDAVVEMNDGNKDSVSMPPSWLLSTAQFSGVFLLTLAAAIVNSMRSAAGSLRALWQIARGAA